MAKRYVDSLEEALAHERDIHEARCQSVRDHVAAFGILRDVAAKYVGQFEPPYSDGWDDVYAELSAVDGHSISGAAMRVYLRRDQTFASVTNILADCERAGLVCTGSEDFAGIRRRTFQLKWAGGRAPHDRRQNINIMVFAHDHSPVCKRVETGSEPTYELICDDSPVPVAA